MKIHDALTPLLSTAALQEVHEHCDALEAMASSRRDKLLVNGLRMLLINHEKRKNAFDLAKRSDNG